MARGVPSVAATRLDIGGWLVVPAIAALATSTASTPASMAASRVAELAAGGVVGVQVHRLVEPLAQRRDEGAGGGGAQQPGHVLDGDDVRAGLGDLLGQAQVVVEGVELLAGAGEVAGVAERDLGDGGAGGADGVDGGAHLADVVERVEDAEDVDAGAGRLGDEGVGDLGRVGRVADRVAPAQQHLQRQVGHRLAQLRRAGPRGPRRGSAARRRRSRRPRPRRDSSCGVSRATCGATCMRSRVRTRVASSDWWASRKVVSVTPTASWARSASAKACGPCAEQPVAGAGRRGSGQVDGGQLGARRDAGAAGAVRLVDRDVGEVGEQLGAAVGGDPRGAQARGARR